MERSAKKNNQGFTLVELLVSIGILAVVGLGIGTVAYQSTRQYRASSAEVGVQQEAQLTGNQLKNLVMDANDGVNIWEGNLSLYSYDAAADARSKSVIRYDGTAQKLFLIQYEEAEGGGASWVPVEDEDGECLAEYVTGFTVTLQDEDGNELTSSADSGNAKVRRVRMQISYGLDGKTYELDQTVTLRNGILAGTLGAQTDGDDDAAE